MSYQCYVFNGAQALVNSVEQYKMNGGRVEDLKILIKDVEHGQLLSAAGLHHVDYLYEITDTNHKNEDQQQTGSYAPYFLGVQTTTGQNFPGVLFGAFNDTNTNAMEALEAYGLSEPLARQALEALRAGQYLLFVPRQVVEQRFKLSDVLSASFGEHEGSSAISQHQFEGAAYTLDSD